MNEIKDMYKRLFSALGHQHWWPGDTRIEIIVGAILTQNTNWDNVEKAIGNLKNNKLLSSKALKRLATRRLAAYIKPSGYFNIKAKRLKNFILFLFEEYGGSLRRMAKEDTALLRHKLLGVNGIGPETADSILLYAFGRPVFVVDAYTKRILYRHNLAEHDAAYHQVQDMFHESVKSDEKIYNEYHALIVRLGKEHCKPKPDCETCPLRDFRYDLECRCPSCYRALRENESDCETCHGRKK